MLNPLMLGADVSDKLGATYEGLLGTPEKSILGAAKEDGAENGLGATYVGSVSDMVSSEGDETSAGRLVIISDIILCKHLIDVFTTTRSSASFGKFGIPLNP